MPPLSDPHGYETLYREHHGWLQQYLLKKSKLLRAGG